MLVYVVAQQSIRLSANGRPVQYATEMSVKLQSGVSASKAIPIDKEDITQSLNTFVMVCDNNKHLIATSGLMGSTMPSYPSEVLGYVNQKGEDRVTWQPQQGLRFASVAIKYNGGYVVAACSLKEPEKLIDTVGRLVLVSWIACAVLSAIIFAILHVIFKKIKG